MVALDPELAEFQAEIGAIEAESEQANRADTPPPDQQRFQDDDGTMYVWDSDLRRFVPAGEMAPSTSYDVADMVYEAEDEKIPAMPAVTQVFNNASSLTTVIFVQSVCKCSLLRSCRTFLTAGQSDNANCSMMHCIF